MPVHYIPHPIQANITNVTGARALCVNAADFTNVYQNNTLRPIFCIIGIAAISAGGGLFCRGIGCVDNVANPNANFTYGGWQVSPGGGEHAQFELSFWVPPGWYYRVYTSIGVGEIVALNIWVEINV